MDTDGTESPFSGKSTRIERDSRGKTAGKSIWVPTLIALSACALLAYLVIATAVEWMYIGGPLGVIAACLLWGGLRQGTRCILWLALVCVVVWLFIFLFEDPRYRSALADLEAGDNVSAIQKLDLVIQDAPDDVDAYLARSKARWKSGRLEPALADCNRAIALGYLWKEDVYALRGRINRDLGRDTQAIRDLTISLRHDANPYVVFDRGQIHSRLARHRDALKDFRIVLRLDPEFDTAWIGIGNAQHGLGDFVRALAAYETYVRKTGRHTEQLADRIRALRKKTGAR